MRETYYIGAYWGNRSESRAACTERLFHTVTELATCHELLTTWHETANSLKKALQKKITPTRDILEHLLKPYKPDVPDSKHAQKLLEALGYSYYFWNGHADRERSMSLNGSCGGAMESPTVSNTVVLSLPRVSDASASLYEPNVLFRILHTLVHAWEPDSAIVMSYEYLSQYLDPDDEWPAGKPYVGWMTYLREKRLAGLKGTPPCEVVDIPGRGKIFIITREHRFSVENPDDLAGAQALTEYLETCGALVPIPTNEPF